MKSTRYALAAGAVAASLVAAAPATAATRLVATVGPGTNISLTKAGKRVTILRPGVYTITVRDRSRFHNFHLRGPRVNRATTVAQVRTVTWTLRLRKGKHTFVCDPHALSMRGSFTVR